LSRIGFIIRSHLQVKGTSDMTILTAQVATVKLGNLEFEGLKLEDGSYGIAIPQIASMFTYFQDSQSQASQKIKRLMGKDFKTHKCKTAFNKNATLAVDIEQFTEILKAIAKKGDLKAQEIRDDLVGLSLTQLLADAFGDKFEKEERQNHLKTRQQNKLDRLSWTDVIKHYMGTHEISDSYKQWIYVNVSDAVNLAVFGKKAKAMREERGVADDRALRDTFTPEELVSISRLESYASKMVIKFDAEPKQALKEAIEFWS
jgi:hypothetical protein